MLIATILVACPACGSWVVGTNGTRKRKSGRVEAFTCHNPHCPFLEGHNRGKQFVLTTSRKFREALWDLLRDLYKDLLEEGAKSKTVARKYNVSPAQVSALRAEIEAAIEDHRGLDQLVDVPQPDTAVAIDETFLKVEGKPIYIIIATGYATRKTLGVKVSATRKEGDMREVFDEAEKNTTQPITTVTSDGWGATQAMVKNLGREVTHVIHPHKKPYDKAVIRHVTYTAAERVITDVGVKTDAFQRRGTREYKYLTKTEPLHRAPPKKRGRPKGVKNGQGKKKTKGKEKGGRRGLLAVFDRGKKGYMKVNPYRETLRLGKNCPAAVAAALDMAFLLFAGMCVQNNLAENINSVLQSLVRLKGPKTAGSAERRVRALLIVRNDPSILAEIQIERNVGGKTLLNNVKFADCGRLAGKGWAFQGLEKMEVVAN